MRTQRPHGAVPTILTLSAVLLAACAPTISSLQPPQGPPRTLVNVNGSQLFLATHRVAGDVYYRRLHEGEFAVLGSISAGHTLVAALAGAAGFHLSLEGWFSRWSQLGWLCGRASRRP